MVVLCFFFFVCEQCTFYPVLAMCMEINNLYLNFFYSTIIINFKKTFLLYYE